MKKGADAPLLAVRDCRFTLVRTEPYKRKDGSETALAVWVGHCVDCGSPFEVTTPLPWTQGFARTKSFGRVRCDMHKRIRAAVHLPR